MCDFEHPPVASLAKQRDHEEEEEQLTAFISDVIRQSRGIYGQRKIKKEFNKQGWTVSRRRIVRIMKAQGHFIYTKSAKIKSNLLTALFICIRFNRTNG
ncbi:hypothetical protein CHH70_19880 [Shouchella clausii]|nr:hypothetical protein CHH70_19880 [Shouchella clausii]